MTVRTYVLGHPRPAPSRGGDCYAHDLTTGPITDRPHVHGPHRFRNPEDCAIQNGLLRLSVNAGSPPSLSMQVRRGRSVILDDVYVDTYDDLYGGVYSTPEWFDAGVVVIDSPDVSAVLTGVRLVDVSAEKVTIRLLASLMDDAYVTLHRGWRSARIQHGDDARAIPAPASVARRVRLTDTPDPDGYAVAGRVEERYAVIGGMYRFVASTDAVTTDEDEFSVTSAAVTVADFGVGVGVASTADRPFNLHQQLGDASRPLHFVREAL